MHKLFLIMEPYTFISLAIGVSKADGWCGSVSLTIIPSTQFDTKCHPHRLQRSENAQRPTKANPELPPLPPVCSDCSCIREQIL